MARGKQTCKILKEIRRQIAEANDIEFITSECRYKGDCLGTCPKCEAEVRYLEQQLRARQLMGKAVVLAGLSAGMITFSSCSSSSSQANDSYRLQGEPAELLEGDDEWDVEGELPVQEVIDSIREEAMKKKGEVGSEDETIISPTNQKQESTATKTVKCPTSFTNAEASDSTKKTEKRKYAVVGEVAETQPEFPGGISAMFQFFAENLKYPPICGDVQGKVIVRFLVDKTGKVRNAEIAKSNLPEEFNKEALRVVQLLPKFKPGERDGIPADVWQAVPISFRLMDYQETE